MIVALLLAALEPSLDQFPDDGRVAACLRSNRAYQEHVLAESRAKPWLKGRYAAALADAQVVEDVYELLHLARRPSGVYQRPEGRAGPPWVITIPWHNGRGWVTVDANKVAHPVVLVTPAVRLRAAGDLRKLLGGLDYERGVLPCHLPLWALPDGD